MAYKTKRQTRRRTMRKRNMNSKRMSMKGGSKPTASADFITLVNNFSAENNKLDKYDLAVQTAKKTKDKPKPLPGGRKGFKEKLDKMYDKLTTYKSQAKDLPKEQKDKLKSANGWPVQNWSELSAFTDYDGFRETFTQEHMNSGAAAIRNATLTPNSRVMQALGI